MSEHVTGRRSVEGRVLKANNETTRVVSIEQLIPHRLYGRFLKRTVKVVAHDQQNASKVGDLVRLQECRPMSRTKRWRLIAILAKSSE
ncbi:MAG: 30S ribosomal protein S17 [Candidatus Latescibacteria bacterium]|nr:30S ribosomal protein S17 [Candidatus Latescibacterota bacterium]